MYHQNPLGHSERKSRPLLLAVNFFPAFFPPNSGGEQRSYHVLRALSELYNVVSITPTYPGTRDEIVQFTATFKELRFTKTRVYQQWGAEFQKSKLGIGGADIAMALSAFQHPKLIAALEQYWSEAEFVLVQHPCAFPAISNLDLTGKRLVYLSHNCEFELASQRLDEGEGHTYLSLVGQLEYRLCHKADHIAVVSSADQAKMRALYGLPRSKFVLVPNGSAPRFREQATLPAGPSTDSASALFIGSNWPPNVEAARYIVTDLAPLLSDISFSIVGNVCRALNGIPLPPNVILHYELGDKAIASLMQKTHVGLNPMISGGGSNVKVADYLAHGLRVVTTAVGARGFSTGLPNIHIAELTRMPTMLAEYASKAPDAEERMRWIKESEYLWNWTTIVNALVDRLQSPLTENGNEDRIIAVFNEFPVTGTSNGGESRIFGLYQAARVDELFVILSFGRKRFAIDLLTDNLICLEIPCTSHQLSAAAKSSSGSYSSVNDIIIPQLVDTNPLWLATAERILAHAQGLVFSHPFMWSTYEYLVAKLPVAHDSHNVETQLKREALETHPRREELINEVERQEHHVVAASEFIAACSESDAEVFRKYGGQNVLVAENGVSMGDNGSFDISTAIAVEGGFGSATFYDRNVYFAQEFDAFSDFEFIAVAYRCLCKREPETDDLKWASSLRAGQSWKAKLLSELMASSENKRRVFVLGARRRAGHPEKIAVFMGSGHRPNLTAAEFIASSVAPHLLDVQFLIIGQVAQSMDPTLTGPNVFCVGFVASAMKSALLSNADVGLNPMIGGGGSNLKIPDYLAHGLPIVSSTFGQRGFSLGEAEGLFAVPLSEFVGGIAKVIASFDAVPFDASRALEIIRTNYAWNCISEKFLHELRRAFSGSQPGLLILCEGSGFLRQNSLSDAGQLVSYWAEIGAIREVILQTFPLKASLASEIKAKLPSKLPRVSLTVRDREMTFTNSGQVLHDRVKRYQLDVIQTAASDEEVLAACERVAFTVPTIISGAGNIADADVHWSFVTDDLIVALPAETLAFEVHGLAHGLTQITVSTIDGQECTTYQADRRFSLRYETNATCLRISTKLLDPQSDIGSKIHIQVYRLSADVGSVLIEANLWCNSAEVLRQLGLPSHRTHFVLGHPLPAVSQELEILLADRALHARAVLAFGGHEFQKAVNAIVKAIAPETTIFGSDGSNLVPLDNAGTQCSIAWPISDIEIGVAKNRKERKYLAGRYIKPLSVVLLAEEFNGEISCFSRRLANAIATRFEGRELAIVCVGEIDREQAAAADNTPSLKFVSPDSAKAMLSILGESSLVIVRGCALSFGRVPALLKLLGISGTVWRTGEQFARDPFEELDAICTVEEVIERLWQGPPLPAHHFDFGTFPAAAVESVNAATVVHQPISEKTALIAKS